jgi:hypothetical protein
MRTPRHLGCPSLGDGDSTIPGLAPLWVSIVRRSRCGADCLVYFVLLIVIVFLLLATSLIYIVATKLVSVSIIV